MNAGWKRLFGLIVSLSLVMLMPTQVLAAPLNALDDVDGGEENVAAPADYKLWISTIFSSYSTTDLQASPFAPVVQKWKDDFNGAKLNPIWYWINENSSKWSLSENPGFLRIYTASGGTGSENLLLRSIGTGSFAIQTHLFFEPAANFQIAGLVIYQDADNFLQLGRAYCYYVDSPCVGNGIYFDETINAVPFEGNFATPVSNPSEAFLRLELQGKLVTAYYSEDGVTWQNFGSHSIPKNFVVNGVGLTSSQNIDPEVEPIPADFDYFAIEPLPPYPAGPANPFIGTWEAIDVDGSDMNMSITGKPAGPFQITWTDDYISYCNGEPGIVRGTGWLNEADPNLLDADLHIVCFTTGEILDFPLSFRYHPAMDTLSSRYSFGQVTIWHHPGKPLPPPPALNLRVNYGHDWVESFYEAGHMAWVLVTESDGVTVKATAETVTEPKDFWGGETGFTTDPEAWVPAQPDIQPNDWVYGWLDNGAFAKVQIGEISGNINLAENSIAGTVLANWFTDLVQVECLDWSRENPYPNVDGGFILPNGSTMYSCSWNEWDIQPGETIGVGYSGPDGNWVSNAFVAPFPRIVASEAGDWLWVTEFYPGMLNISIYASADEAATLLWSGHKEAVDLYGVTVIEPSDHGLDLVPGNYVVVSDGVNEKGVVLEPISMNLFDVVHDVMAGTAPAGRDVTAAAGPQEWQERITVQADSETGAWMADFKTKNFDITEDMQPWSFAQIYDKDGDANEAGAPLPPQVTLSVNGVNDVLADDGICTLREAIIAANTNTQSGTAEGECPAGLNYQTDTIVLDAGQTYSLTTDRTDDTEYDGDLDIWDNAADLDLVIRVEGEGKATIPQDASVDDRVIENHGGYMQIENLILTRGGNVGSGGGLLNNGIMDVISSEIDGNTAGWDGGGIYNSEIAIMNIDSSAIANNSALIGGGAVNQGTLTLLRSEVNGNTDLYYGGGINNAGTLTIDNSILVSNSSDHQGGALYNSGTATITNGTRVGGDSEGEANVAGDGGGGLFNIGTLSVTESIVIGNQSTSYGGGLFNWTGGMLTIDHSIISQNAANEAGGLHNKEGSTAVVQNETIFSNNVANFGAGAIQNWGTITINESVLQNNQTLEGNGDALGSNVSETNSATITGSCIVGNGDVAVYNNNMTLFMNATSNWWGDPSGPSGSGSGSGDSVGDYINFSGWLTEPPAICTTE